MALKWPLQSITEMASFLGSQGRAPQAYFLAEGPLGFQKGSGHWPRRRYKPSSESGDTERVEAEERGGWG